MPLRYSNLKKKPTVFKRLFGVSPQEFEEILTKVEPLFTKKILDGYKRPGRPYKHDLAEHLLMLLLYYRCYVTQEFVGCLFDLDKSRVCRMIKALEPLLAQVMAIDKRKKLSQKEMETLLIDATEQPIERPKKGQRTFYSGKKKRHTMKTEIRVTKEGKIVHVSKTHPGSAHDFTVFKQELPPPKGSRVYVDSGYQGIDHFHKEAEFPYKASKTKPLDEEEKEYNQALSRIRVRVEHIIGDLKTFKILSERYRNKRKRYHLKVNIIAGIVNLKNGFKKTA